MCDVWRHLCYAAHINQMSSTENCISQVLHQKRSDTVIRREDWLTIWVVQQWLLLHRQGWHWEAFPYKRLGVSAVPVWHWRSGGFLREPLFWVPLDNQRNPVLVLMPMKDGNSSSCHGNGSRNNVDELARDTFASRQKHRAFLWNFFVSGLPPEGASHIQDESLHCTNIMRKILRGMPGG